MRDESWHDREEQFLTKIEKQCNAYTTYFNKDYQYYHTLSSRFNIPILVISSINALTAISLNEFLTQTYVSILNAILSAGTGILGSIQLYMKINEKMANALRSQILMKRLALKISKELSIDRAQRATEGQTFLQECFGEFNAALEQANPIEKKIQNFLALGEQPPMATPMSFMNLAAAAVNAVTTPKRGSSDDSTLRGRLPRLSEPRAKTLWGLLGEGRTNADSPQESLSPPDRSASSQGGESPRVRDAEP
jgi:hypothetical protein